jgi:diguanylate cyclase (GGDEF)-like protein
MEPKKQTILIVDDEPENIEILSELLGSEYEVFFAINGLEALEIAAGQVPDLILLDILLTPEMDGYEVCSRLKKDPKTMAIPVIFITAMDREEDEARGLEAGAMDYITKPISPPIVRARVRNHLELKRYHDILENLSVTDGLTGIANRRRFDQFLEREWRRAIRSRSPLSLILMDIDLFKTFNDHYGHLAGVDALRTLAQGINEVVQRPADLLARYGGEEFACILPETDTHGATTVANNIRQKIDDLNIAFPCPTSGNHITVSMGLATLVPLKRQSSADLIRFADELLYEAKRLGRNLVVTRSSGGRS